MQHETCTSGLKALNVDGRQTNPGFKDYFISLKICVCKVLKKDYTDWYTDTQALVP